jgi:hypothetical protein
MYLYAGPDSSNPLVPTNFTRILENLALRQQLAMLKSSGETPAGVACRPRLSLNKDPPETRIVEPPKLGKIIAFPHVGGLHHRYGRIAA